MSMPTEAPLTVVPHATCLGCGCLCDDIEVGVASGRVVAATRACPVGLGWFQAPHPGEGHPLATVEGRAVPLEEAVDRAALILRGARSPMVWGLTSSSVEAVGEALRIADRLGATVDLAGSGGRANHRAAFVRVGQVSASLGEVRQRAEVVLFWGNHPEATHPRHAERYSVRRQGRFLKGDRSVIVVDVGLVPLEGRADLRLAIAPDRQGDALAVLHALSNGVTLDPGRVERATGQPLSVWEDVVGRFQKARSGAIFFGPSTRSLGMTGWDSALGLVRDLNAGGRRCVGLSLGEPGNVSGAEAVLCWQAGAPSGVDFALGHPRSLPEEATLVERLRSGEVDAVLAVGVDPTEALPADALDRLAATPWILVGPGACRPPEGRASRPSVAIDSGRLGIESGGTVARVDGVMLPLRPPLLGELLTDQAILCALTDRLAIRGDG